MSKKLELAPGLSLPIEAVTKKFGFFGQNGSGKTYGAMKLAELMLGAGGQIVAIDPVGKWYGLRLAANGKDPSGIEIPVFGGLHGDIPLESTAGELVADVIVDRGISAVLDVSQFEYDAERARFVEHLCRRLFHRKKSAPSAIHIFFEEAQEFLPMAPQRGEEKLVHEALRIGKIGRNYGFGWSLITPRPQEITTKARNLSEVVLAFQTNGTHERKAIAEWVKEKGQDQNVVDLLPKLKPGFAHAWSPSWLEFSGTVHINKKETFDASATPLVGAKAVEAKPLGSIDLAQLQKAMAATIEKRKAEDPAELRKQLATAAGRIRQLEKGAGVKTVEKSVPDQGAIDREVKRALGLAQRQHHSTLTNLRKALEAAMKFILNISTHNFDVAGIDKAELTKALEAAVGRATDILDRQLTNRAARIDQLRQNAQQIVNQLQAVLKDEEVVVAVDVTRNEAFTVAAPAAQPARRVSAPAVPLVDGLTGPQIRILNEVAQLHLLGVERPAIKQIAVFCGVSPSTGSFLQNIRDLAGAGYLERGKGDARLTELGEKSAAADLPGRDLFEMWVHKLDGPQGKMLRTIRDARSISKDALAAALGVSPSTGSYLQNLRDLRGYGVVDYDNGIATLGQLMR